MTRHKDNQATKHKEDVMKESKSKVGQSLVGEIIDINLEIKALQQKKKELMDKLAKAMKVQPGKITKAEYTKKDSVCIHNNGFKAHTVFQAAASWNSAYLEEVLSTEELKKARSTTYRMYLKVL